MTAGLLVRLLQKALYRLVNQLLIGAKVGTCVLVTNLANLIVCWGQGSTASGSGVVTFPVTFSSVYSGFCSAIGAFRWNVMTYITITGATLYAGSWNSSGGITGTNVSSTVKYSAIGY